MHILLQVSLGIVMKNVYKTDEMCKIMAEAYNYVPALSVKRAAPLPDGSVIEYNDKMWETLFGGDQLTAARARGAIDMRDDHGILEDMLHGFVSSGQGLAYYNDIAEGYIYFMVLYKIQCSYKSYVQ